MNDNMKQNPEVILNTLGSFAFRTETLGEKIRRGRKKLDQKPSSASKRKSISQGPLEGHARKKVNLKYKSEDVLTDEDEEDDDDGIEIVDEKFNKAAFKQVIKQEKEGLDALISSTVTEKVNEGFQNQLIQLKSLFSDIFQKQINEIKSAVAISAKKENMSDVEETPISTKKRMNKLDVSNSEQPEINTEEEKLPISDHSHLYKEKEKTPLSCIKKEKMNTPSTTKPQISIQLPILEHTPKSEIIKEDEESESESDTNPETEGEFTL